ncbi:MAG: hypothetical protein ACYDBV_13410 [Nitrospiria bacterium]
MKTIKFNFSIDSHYSYENDEIKFINVFQEDEKGCFTRSQAHKFIRDCNDSSRIKNEIIFKTKKKGYEMDSLTQTLIDRDELTEEQARQQVQDMVHRVLNGEDPEEVLYEIGLEPDYVIDLLDFCC